MTIKLAITEKTLVFSVGFIYITDLPILKATLRICHYKRHHIAVINNITIANYYNKNNLCTEFYFIIS